MKKLIFSTGLGLLLSGAFLGAEETKKDEKVSLVKIGYTTAKDGEFKYKGHTVYIENLLNQSESGFGSFYFGLTSMELDECPGAGVIKCDSDGDTFSIGYKHAFGKKDETGLSANEAYNKSLEGLLPYLKLGYSRTKGSAWISIPTLGINQTYSGSESGVSYGFGMEKASKSFGVFAEYMKYTDDNFDDDAITLGVVFRF